MKRYTIAGAVLLFAAALVSQVPKPGSGGSGSGDVSGQASSVDSEVALFSGTGGKTIKRATGSGLAKLASGVLSVATSGTDYALPPLYDTRANIAAATCGSAQEGRLGQTSDFPYLLAWCRSSVWNWRWRGAPITIPVCTNQAEVNYNGATSTTSNGVIRVTETGGDTATHNYKLLTCDTSGSTYTLYLDIEMLMQIGRAHV